MLLIIASERGDIKMPHIDVKLSNGFLDVVNSIEKSLSEWLFDIYHFLLIDIKKKHIL